MQGDTPSLSYRAWVVLMIAGVVVGTVWLGLFLAQSESFSPPTLPPTPTPTPPSLVVTGDSAIVVVTATPALTLTATLSMTATPDPLALPCATMPPDWVAYEIQRGDTLFSLALQAGTTITALKQTNCLEMDEVLLPDTVLYLPDMLPTRPSCGPPIWWVQYVVQAGDTMYSLARARQTNVTAVRQANCLFSTNLVAGMVIYLPPSPALPTPTPSSTATSVPPVATNPPALPTATFPPSPTPTAVPPTPTAVPPTPTLTPQVTLVLPTATPPSPTPPPPTNTAVPP